MTVSFKQIWNLLARHIAPQRTRFALLTLLLLGSTGLQVINPQIVRAFIDASSTQSVETLAAAALAFIGIALIQQVVGVGATYVGENVAWTATNTLRAELAHHCLSLDMTFHDAHAPGEMIERIDGDVAQLATFFSELVIRVGGNVLLMAGIVIALWLQDWRLGVAFAVFATTLLLVLNRMRDIAVPYQKVRRQAEADLFGFVEERLTGTEDIRSNGAVDYVLRRLYQLQHAIMKSDYRASAMGWLISMTTNGVLAAGTIAAVIAGYILYRNRAITLGTVYVMIYYLNLLAEPIHELAHHVESFQTIGASVERLIELRRIERTVKDGSGAAVPGAAVPGTAMSSGPLSLVLERVSFAYVEHESVLHDLSLHLRPGKVLGLLGRTGSGKTTLARLILRLYDPTAGRISLNGVEARQPLLKTLRQRVALVTQDVQLFRGTLRDNLTLFDRNISDEHIRAVIEELELADWYESLPNGLDTLLEAGGRGLSAGEAQLVAFARVFMRNPGLVILDEASSRLDPATEQRIERAVDHLLRDRTAIIIAHRLGTVQRADEIMILDGGRVAEYGEREQLAADPASRFYGLLQTGLEEVLV
jgi:ABC-type multidrug transport system fused ATPase/permease subunit